MTGLSPRPIRGGKRLTCVPVGQIDRQDKMNAILLKLDKASVQALPGVPIKRHYKAGDGAGEAQLTAYVFAGSDKAAAMVDYLKDQAESLDVHSMAVLTRDADGKTTFHDSADMSVVKSRVVGVFIGGLADLLAEPQSDRREHRGLSACSATPLHLCGEILPVFAVDSQMDTDGHRQKTAIRVHL